MTTVKTDIDAEIDQRQLVTTYENCGCGPQALAIVTLLEVPFTGKPTYAYCLNNSIPLDPTRQESAHS